MKVALLGVGRIGPLHAATLSKLPAVEEVLIADIVTQRAEAVAADVGARAMASVKSALDVIPEVSETSTQAAMSSESQP